MAKQTKCITSDKAVERKRQHKTPCSDCPWRRDSLPGWLGGLQPGEWVALAHSEGSAACHTIRDKACAGLAIYRANVCKSVRDPKALRLPVDHNTVFSMPVQFLLHHGQVRITDNEETAQTSQVGT